MLGSQIGVFVLLVLLGNPWIFGALICYVLLCYGGGFGCMPSFVMDKFGPKLMTAVYGVILTAWAAGGIVGPQLFAMVKDRVEPARAPGLSFMIGGGFLVLGLILSFMIDNAPVRPKTT
jgi:OFA family oxalate/formate antiporter-like MFS transporter